MVTRETRLTAAFVELAEAMVVGVDLVDFPHRLSCHAVDLLEVDAAGVMLADEHDRLRAISHGYGWLCGLPLRHGNEVIGALNLFRERDEPLGDPDVQVGQALADVATVALLQRRETTQARRQADQLQAALDSRVLIEQAKGVLAQRLGVSLEEAFQALRRTARNTNRELHELSNDVVRGDPETIGLLNSA